MSARLEVVKDVTGQRVYFYPPQGRPTATPSVSIKDESGSTVTAAATTNVTLDLVSTTVSVAGAVGDTSLTLTSAANIEWRETYLVTNVIGQKEWVRIASVNTSTKVVEFDEPLRYAHDTAATFVGIRFYRTLQAAEVDTLVELYRARATYAVGGLNYVMEIPFDVVLTPIQNLLTVEFIKRRRPDIMASEPSETRGTDFADLRESAWDQVLKGIREQSTAQGEMRPALIRTPEDIEQWALAEFDLLCQLNGTMILRNWPDQERAVRYLEEKVLARKQHSLLSLKFYDESEDDSRGPHDDAPLRMNLIR